MVELIRTNDLVLISVVETLFDEAGITAFVADAYISSLEGSIGAFPRRILVDPGQEAKARRLLTEAGLGGELRDPSRR